MLRQTLGRSCCAAAALLLLVAAPALGAQGDEGTGGLAAAERPQVERVVCGDAATGGCATGEELELTGSGLDAAETVVFMGSRSRRDDRLAAPTSRRFSKLTVIVPAGARSGPVQVAARRVGRSKPTRPVKVIAAKSSPASKALVADPVRGAFPIRGAHDYGTEVNRFGGGRSHKGQDVFAKCGTPLVAALSGTVSIAKFQDRAGNYAVVNADDGTSQAYMHMRLPATVKKGDRVRAGQPIGEVGETGRATGCHLHFELWTAPGWYEGGTAIDPLPFLRELDRAS